MARNAGRRETRGDDERQRAPAPPRPRRDPRATGIERPGRRVAAPARHSLATVILNNPAAAGAVTALLVAMGFVSANALWYQPYRHPSAFFETRPAPARGEEGTASGKSALVPAVDPTLRRVQSALKDAGIYTGSVDGLNGPDTRKAIAAFQAAHSLPASGQPDIDMVAKLIDGTSATAQAQSAAPPEGDRKRTMKIQAGLKAFGNDGIEVDGIMGARTRAAIREFQQLFGLQQTGEPDATLYAKMKEVGLTD